jgi:hypothetical protein
VAVTARLMTLVDVALLLEREGSARLGMARRPYEAAAQAVRGAMSCLEAAEARIVSLESDLGDERKVRNGGGLFRLWQPEEDAFILGNAHLDAADIAASLGRGIEGVRTRAHKHLRVRLGRSSGRREARRNMRWAEAKNWLLERVEFDTNGGCWLWPQYLASNGYAHTRMLGEQITVHRLSWRVFRGNIPRGLVVCHRCDVRACCNPDHLFLGTHADNIADMISKGRHSPRRGEQNTLSKLTEDQAVTIIARAGAGEPLRSLALEYGVSYSTIYYVKTGRSWPHLDRPTPAISRRKLAA